MKKYLVLLVTLLLIFCTYQYLVFSKGIYFRLSHEEVKTNFVVENKQIYRYDGNDKIPFTVRGVQINSFLPGYNGSDYKPDEETYLRWLQQIQDMGANTVRVDTIMDEDFYNAFYSFNKQAEEEPLYLLQGILVDDYPQSNRYDAYQDGFLDSLQQDAMTAIDVVHGKKNVLFNRGRGQGFYRKDISQWVLGFVIGNDWNSETIAYTNHKSVDKKDYQGTYVQTTKDASAFEGMLARVMERFYKYETEKYDQQHLVTFSNDPMNDPFQYNENYSLQSRKITILDSEHITISDKVISGMFTTYRMRDLSKEIVKQIEDEKCEALLKRINTDLVHGGYVQLLSQYHTTPVVIGSYGYSTSRGIESEAMVETNGGGMNEKEQGEALVETYEGYIDSGAQGACIRSWSDNWGLRTWNTSFAKEVGMAKMWKDVQSNDTGYGILSFDDGKETTKYQCDGNASEWTDKEKIMEKDGTALYMHTDSAYVYFMVHRKGLSKHDQLYIPLDITEESGVKKSQKPALQYNRPIDFLLSIHGDKDSRLLVTPRYQAVNANYAEEIHGIDAYVDVPAKNNGKLEKVMMILQRSKLIKDFANTSPQDRRSPVFETGKLRAGNSNPKAENYDSQTDFCYGEDMVEIRIPWLLLNFSDPSEQLIHDDYYKNYGVKSISAYKIYAGAAINSSTSDTISLHPFTLQGWESVTYHERLKQSYQILQEAWKGDAS